MTFHMELGSDFVRHCKVKIAVCCCNEADECNETESNSKCVIEWIKAVKLDANFMWE